MNNETMDARCEVRTEVKNSLSFLIFKIFNIKIDVVFKITGMKSTINT